MPLDHATVDMGTSPRRDVTTERGAATLSCRALAAVPPHGLVFA